MIAVVIYSNVKCLPLHFYKESFHRMLEEMNQVLGERDNVTFDDINRLEYLGQVIKETLRLYPPAMGTARESVDRTVLHGYHIPSGTQLVVGTPIYNHKEDD